jgi:hypothetical protein
MFLPELKHLEKELRAAVMLTLASTVLVVLRVKALEILA